MPIPKGYSSPERVSAKERAFLQIQRWIVDGTLQPGEKLYDGELAEALAVSRTPVREALQTLELQGFVEMHRGRDTRVTQISRDDIRKIYPPLASLQSLAAKLVTHLVTKSFVEQLRGINGEFAVALEHRESYQAMELDDEFHNAIVELTENPYISSFVSTLQLHARRLKYVFFQDAMLSTESVFEHDEVIHAFEQRDSVKAAQIMQENWLRPMHELSESIVTGADEAP